MVGDKYYIGSTQGAFFFIGIEYRSDRLVRDRFKIPNLSDKLILCEMRKDVDAGKVDYLEIGTPCTSIASVNFCTELISRPALNEFSDMRSPSIVPLIRRPTMSTKDEGATVVYRVAPLWTYSSDTFGNLLTRSRKESAL